MPHASLLTAAALLAGLLIATPAQAGCTASTVPVAFGAYNPSGDAKTGVGSIRVACDTNENGVGIAISAGNSGNQTQRRMTNGASQLSYSLHTDAGHTMTWGNGVGGTATLNLGRINRTSVSRTIYGRIPAGQNVTAGTYTDTLIVTVVY